MDVSTDQLKRLAGQPLSSLVDSRQYTPLDLKGQYEDPSIKLPPLESIAPGATPASTSASASGVYLSGQSLHLDATSQNYEWFDLPTKQTYKQFAVRWDLWLYFVFYIIVLLISLLFFINVQNSKFFREFNYPTWAPSSWVLLIIWAAVFITSMFSLWVLSSHVHANFYVLLLLMNIIFIMLFIISIWFTGVVILGSVVIAIGVLFAIFVCVAMSRDSMLAMGLQIPYILFLILLFVISLQISHTSD